MNGILVNFIKCFSTVVSLLTNKKKKKDLQ